MLAGETVGEYQVIAQHLSPSVGRDIEAWCPVCGEDLTYVKQSTDGRIAHFRHQTEPKHERIAESAKHERIKLDVYETLANKYQYVSLEYDINNRIADIFVGDESVVVEIQCATQSVDEFKSRTRDYSEVGAATVWLIDRETYLPKKTGTSVSGVRYSDHVKWLENVWDDWLYVIDSVGEYNRYKIRNAERWVESYKSRGGYMKDYKTVGKLQHRTPIEWDFAQTTNYNVYKIAKP